VTVLFINQLTCSVIGGVHVEKFHHLELLKSTSRRFSSTVSLTIANKVNLIL